MRGLNVVRQAARLALAGVAAVVMQTAQAATVAVTADLTSPFAEDQDHLSGEGFVESAYARAEAGYGFGKVSSSSGCGMALWELLVAQATGMIIEDATFVVGQPRHTLGGDLVEDRIERRRCRRRILGLQASPWRGTTRRGGVGA